MSQFNIRGIPPALVDHFWKLAEPYIKRALDHANGEFLPEDLRAFCTLGAIQLWLISEKDRVVGACTTEIIPYPRRRHLRIVTLGGSHAKEWLSELDIILCAWAKEQNCQGVEAYVRKGFVPVLANYGYSHKYSSVIKDLE